MNEQFGEDVGGDAKLEPVPRAPIRVTSDNNLPTATTRIVGRREFVELVKRQLETLQLVSIVGAGGVGKTTVAVATAQQAIGLYRDGVWLVDFAPLRDPSLVANAIASATGLVVHSANILPALCRSLRDREILLVLDNCEHMIDEIIVCVKAILSEAPAVRVLTTSREPLQIDGEQVNRLPGLTTPAPSPALTAADALTFPAVQLFVDRSTDKLAGFVLTDAEAPTVAEICKRLDGIALAIELAAMRIDVFGVQGLQSQLADRFRVLAGRRGGLERHRTLAATLDWSYGLLSAAEAALLRGVSVFAGVFQLDDALAVSDEDCELAAATLSELAAKSLLSVDFDAPPVAYRLLETTRAYCIGKREESGEDASIRLRHAEYVCARLERAGHEWGQKQSREWGAANRRYLDELRAALAWASADPVQPSLLVRLTAAGTQLWNHFSLTNESRVHLTRALCELPQTSAAGTAVEMRLQLALAGALLFTKGAVPEARDAMQRALHVAEEIGHTECRLRCLRMMGSYHLFCGEPEIGINALESFLSFAASNDPSALPEGESHLAIGEMIVGRLWDSRRRLERLNDSQAQELAHAKFARFQYSGSVMIMVMLSHVQWVTGSPDKALQTAAAAIAYGRETQHELSLSVALAFACTLFFWTGREEEYLECVVELDELVERHGIVMWRPVATFSHGALAIAHSASSSGQLDHLERAIAEFRQLRYLGRLLPYYMGALAEAYVRHNDLPNAEDAIRAALDCATKQNERWTVPELLRVQATIAQAQGRKDEAETILTQSISIANGIGALSWRLRAATDLARVQSACGRVSDAKIVLQASYAAFTEGFETRDLAVARRLLDELSA